MRARVATRAKLRRYESILLHSRAVCRLASFGEDRLLPRRVKERGFFDEAPLGIDGIQLPNRLEAEPNDDRVVPVARAPVSTELVSTEYPRASRGVAATRLRNIHPAKGRVRGFFLTQEVSRGLVFSRLRGLRVGAAAAIARRRRGRDR